MSDSFQRGIERAFARRKQQQREYQRPVVIKSPGNKGKVNIFSGFDEEIYKTMIISEMIKLIHKTKE